MLDFTTDDERWKDQRLKRLPTIHRVPKSRRKQGWAQWVVRSADGEKTFRREWDARQHWLDRVTRETAREGKDSPIEFVSSSLLQKLEPSRQANTLATYMWVQPHILKTFSGRNMRSITVEELVDFRAKVASHPSPYLAGRAMFLLRQIFLHAKALEFITLDPFDELPEVPLEQRARLAEAIAARCVTAPPDSVIMMMLEAPGPLGDVLNTLILLGPRIREALALDRHDFDSDDCSIHIWRQMTKKGVLKTKFSERYVPVCDELATRLAVGDEGFAQCDSPLLIDPDGKRWSYRSALKAFQDWQVDVGLAFRGADGVLKGHYTIHQLRHAFVAVMLALSVDIVAIADWLGHSSIATTLNIYAGLLDQTDGEPPTFAVSSDATVEYVRKVDPSFPRSPISTGAEHVRHAPTNIA